MPLTISTSGYIEVYRGGVFVSRHNVESNAIEAVIAHAELNGDGDYELRYPNKVVMSRLKKQVVPFSWNPITLAFVNGTASSVSLAGFLANPENRAVSYSVTGTLPTGVTLAGSTVSYNGSGAVASASVRFNASWNGLTAVSNPSTVSINVAPPTNRAPTFTVAPASATIPYTGGTIQFTASDPDADTLTYTLPVTRSGITINNATGLVTVASSATGTTGSITVRVTDPAGAYAEASCAVTVQSQPVSGALLLFDDFNYVVNRDDVNKNVFLSHGWTEVKSLPERTGAGYIYTTTTIPGYSGQMPGQSGSGRVLCLEGRPSLNLARIGLNQTDFYLGFGGAIGTIPANSWWQFWFFINDTPTQPSRWSDGSKFLYPSPDGTYNVPDAATPWQWDLANNSYETDGSSPVYLPYGSSQYVQNRPATADYQNASEYPGNRNKLGPNLAKATGYWQANRWYLIKINQDISGTQGIYRMWVRQMNGAWAQWANWTGGVTPGFSWPTQTSQRAGLAKLRWPTTWGTTNSDSTNYDAWVYIADFALANAESALPVYGAY